MKKAFSKSLSWLLSVVILCVGFVTAPIKVDAYTGGHTQNEAVAWAQSKVGQYLDYDGAYGAQCVDLILYYYSYLGCGISRGNAKDYTWNAIPDGWERINNYNGFTPHPGDVCVWSGGQYGHIGIVKSGDSSTIYTFEQNVNGGPVNNYTRSTSSVACFIRPDFMPVPVSVSFSEWHNDNFTYIGWTDASIGEQIDVSGGTGTAAGMYLYDVNGNQIGHGHDDTFNYRMYYRINEELGITLESGTTYKYKFYVIVNGETYWGPERSFKTDGPTEVKSISVDKTSIVIGVGEKASLSASISPNNATDKTVTWISSNETVAIVSEGIITAKKAGIATITAKTANGKTASCDVTVHADSPEIRTIISAQTIKLGESVTITIIATGGSGNYTYAVLYKEVSAENWTTKQDFDTNNIVSIKPAKSTNYIVRVIVEDSNGRIVENSFTVKVTDVLKNNSTLSKTAINLGDTITVNGKATGGTGSYQYNILYKQTAQSKWTTVQSYEENSTVTIKPTKATTYDVCVKVKDSNGTEVKKYFTVKVTDVLKNNSTLSKTEINLGSTITVNGKATGGSGSYQYNILYKQTAQSKWTTVQSYDENSTVKIEPTKATTYDVCVKVKDSDGTEVKEYFTVNVTNNKLKNISTVSAETITLGESVTVNANATGSTGFYIYSVYYKKTSDTKWTTAQDFKANNKVIVNPAKATSYDICVKVKDDKGNVDKKYFTVNVVNKLKNVSTVSAKTINIGESVTVNANATGSTGLYTYAVYYKQETQTKWTTAQDFKANNKVTVKPTKATSYDICVKVKDDKGNVDKKYFTVNVVKNELKNISTVSAETINIGESVTVNANATGSTGLYTYAVYYKQETQTRWTIAQDFNANNKVTVNPIKATSYDICVKVKDGKGTVDKKYFKVNVTDFRNTSTISQTEITLGQKIEVNCSATGSTGFYQYAVYYKKTSNTKWTTKQNYSSNNTVTFKPTEATTYDICVEIKDNQDNIVKKYFEVTVK